MTPLTLYNSLTREPEQFAPIDPANVRVYSCGPTVYQLCRIIGNLRAYVFTDTLARVAGGGRAIRSPTWSTSPTSGT